MLIHALGFLAIYLACLILLFLTGQGLLFLSRQRLQLAGTHTRIFFSLFLGLISLVTVYSLIKAQLNSINLFIPLLGCLLLCNRHPFKFQVAGPQPLLTKATFISLLPAFISLLLPFVYFCFILFKNGDFFYRAVDADAAVYSRLSEQLSTVGLENRWLNYFGEHGTATRVGPYHYFDLWFNALVLQLFNVKALPALYLVTYPLLVTIGLSGILALVEFYKPVKPLQHFIAIACIFIGPVYAIRSQDTHFNAVACAIPLEHYGEKFAVYYPFILVALLLYVNNYAREALLALSGLCIVSFTVYSALLLFTVSMLLFLPKKDWWKYAGKLVLIYGGIFLFYLFNGNFSPGSDTDNLWGNCPSLNIKGMAVNTATLSASGLARFAANYCYALPLLLYFWMKNKLPRLSLCLLVSGLVVASLFYCLQDHDQLFNNLLPVFHCTVLLLFIMLLYSKPLSKTATYLLPIFLFSNTLYTAYCAFKEYRTVQARLKLSDDYLLRLCELSKGMPGAKVGYIYNQQDFDRLYTTANGNYLYHLAYTDFDPLPVNLSCVTVTNFSKLGAGSALFESFNRKEAFYRYFKQQVKLPEQDAESIALSFMHLHNIHFVLLSPGSPVPDFLGLKIKETVEDKQLGLRLLVLE